MDEIVLRPGETFEPDPHVRTFRVRGADSEPTTPIATDAEELFRQVAASYTNETDSRRHDERREAISWAAGEIERLRAAEKTLDEMRATVIEYFRCADGAGTLREKRTARDRLARLVNGDTAGEA